MTFENLTGRFMVLLKSITTISIFCFILAIPFVAGEREFPNFKTWEQISPQNTYCGDSKGIKNFYCMAYAGPEGNWATVFYKKGWRWLPWIKKDKLWFLMHEELFYGLGATYLKESDSRLKRIAFFEKRSGDEWILVDEIICSSTKMNCALDQSNIIRDRYRITFVSE